jgi:tyrosyl-tRNA synthetase
MPIFSKKNTVDEDKVEELINRGVANIYPTPEFLKEKLLSGERQTIYLGIDPTGPTLHIGHAVSLKKLKLFQELGHKVILLIGDFTATIGDPSGKSETRKPLTRDEVLENAKLYQKQASKFLDFTGKNRAELKYNSEWLAKMALEDVLRLASLVTVDQMLKRDMFIKRSEEGKPIFIHEFMYPLMQGYDSVAMEVTGEMGATDQTFNMLMGRQLVRNILGKEKFVFTTKLLEDSTGKKMGKTEGNVISFLDGPDEMFGKVMNWTDTMMYAGFELCTNVSFELLEKKRGQIKEDPYASKLELAKEVVSVYYSPDDATLAQENFLRAFKEGEISSTATEVKTKSPTNLSQILLEQKIVPSKTEMKRLIKEGAISNTESKEKITDIDFVIDKSSSYKIGKKRFLRVIVEN